MSQNLAWKKYILDNRFFWPIVIFVFIMSRLATWFYPVDSDHWIFYYVGKTWIEGGNLYISAWDHKPPMIFLFNGIMHLFFGANLLYHRIFLTLVAVLDIYLFYLFLKTILSKTNLSLDLYSRIGLLLYVFLRNLSQLTSSGNNTENFGLTFLLLMFLSFFVYRKLGQLRYLLLSGFFLSILFYLKGNFLLLSLPIVFALFWTNRRNFYNLFVNLALFGLPLLMQTLFWFAYFYRNGYLADFLIASFFYSSKYMQSTWQDKVSDRSNFIWLILPLIIFLLITIASYLQQIWRTRLGFWQYFSISLIVSTLVFASVLGSLYPYYYLILVPFLVVVFVQSLPIKIGFSKIFKTNTIWLQKLQSFGSFGIIIVLMASLWFISSKQLYNSFAGNVYLESQENQQIVDYIDQNSSKDDKIISYSYGATFYALSNRKAASRFVSASYLLLDWKENFGYNFNQIFLQEIQLNKPKYVIFPSSSSNLYIQNTTVSEYLQTHFSVVKSWQHYVLLVRLEN